VANDFKNHSRWKLLPEVDCDMPADTWPDLETLGCSRIVIVDDFVGSGQTLLGLVRGQVSPIRLLGEQYRTISVTIMLIAGFEQAIEEFLVQAPQIKIIVWKRFSDRDRCFSSQSKIFTDSALRARFEAFCVEVASTNYPSIRAKHRLGHNGIGCLTSFAETVPNNTLPIIWHDQGPWFPLLPASGML
jgi:hypoxanthine phosphoribosyltransferase